MEPPMRVLCPGWNVLPACMTLLFVCLVSFEQRSALCFLHGTSTSCPWGDTVSTGVAAPETQNQVGERLELVQPGCTVPMAVHRAAELQGKWD